MSKRSGTMNTHYSKQFLLHLFTSVSGTQYNDNYLLQEIKYIFYVKIEWRTLHLHPEKEDNVAQHGARKRQGSFIDAEPAPRSFRPVENTRDLSRFETLRKSGGHVSGFTKTRM